MTRSTRRLAIGREIANSDPIKKTVSKVADPFTNELTTPNNRNTIPKKLTRPIETKSSWSLNHKFRPHAPRRRVATYSLNVLLSTSQTAAMRGTSPNAPPTTQSTRIIRRKSRTPVNDRHQHSKATQRATRLATKTIAQ